MKKMLIALAALKLAIPLWAVEGKPESVTPQECSFLKDTKSAQLRIDLQTDCAKIQKLCHPFLHRCDYGLDGAGRVSYESSMLRAALDERQKEAREKCKAPLLLRQDGPGSNWWLCQAWAEVLAVPAAGAPAAGGSPAIHQGIDQAQSSAAGMAAALNEGKPDQAMPGASAPSTAQAPQPGDSGPPLITGQSQPVILDRQAIPSPTPAPQGGFFSKVAGFFGGIFNGMRRHPVRSALAAGAAGVGLGFLFGGPIGALIGGLIACTAAAGAGYAAHKHAAGTQTRAFVAAAPAAPAAAASALTPALPEAPAKMESKLSQTPGGAVYQAAADAANPCKGDQAFDGTGKPCAPEDASQAPPVRATRSQLVQDKTPETTACEDALKASEQPYDGCRDHPTRALVWAGVKRAISEQFSPQALASNLFMLLAGYALAALTGPIGVFIKWAVGVGLALWTLKSLLAPIYSAWQEKNSADPTTSARGVVNLSKAVATFMIAALIAAAGWKIGKMKAEGKLPALAALESRLLAKLPAGLKPAAKAKAIADPAANPVKAGAPKGGSAVSSLKGKFFQLVEGVKQRLMPGEEEAPNGPSVKEKEAAPPSPKRSSPPKGKGAARRAKAEGSPSRDLLPLKVARKRMKVLAPNSKGAYSEAVIMKVSGDSADVVWLKKSANGAVGRKGIKLSDLRKLSP